MKEYKIAHMVEIFNPRKGTKTHLEISPLKLGKVEIFNPRKGTKTLTPKILFSSFMLFMLKYLIPVRGRKLSADLTKTYCPFLLS